jgi:hypothetical protein
MRSRTQQSVCGIKLARLAEPGNLESWRARLLLRCQNWKLLSSIVRWHYMEEVLAARFLAGQLASCRRLHATFAVAVALLQTECFGEASCSVTVVGGASGRRLTPRSILWTICWRTSTPGQLESGRRHLRIRPQLEIPKFHNKPGLVGVEKPVAFRLADWLPKGTTRTIRTKSSRRVVYQPKVIENGLPLAFSICGLRRLGSNGSEVRKKFSVSVIVL